MTRGEVQGQRSPASPLRNPSSTRRSQPRLTLRKAQHQHDGGHGQHQPQHQLDRADSSDAAHCDEGENSDNNGEDYHPHSRFSSGRHQRCISTPSSTARNVLRQILERRHRIRAHRAGVPGHPAGRDSVDTSRHCGKCAAMASADPANDRTSLRLDAAVLVILIIAAITLPTWRLWVFLVAVIAVVGELVRWRRAHKAEDRTWRPLRSDTPGN
jgi:hypothetical protein